MWRFRGAADKREEFDESVIDDNRNVRNIMIRVKQQILARGAYGLRSLAREFEALGQSHLEFKDFKWGLRNYGLQLSEDEVKLIFSTFEKEGKIEVVQFVNAFRVSGSADLFRAGCKGSACRWCSGRTSR